MKRLDYARVRDGKRRLRDLLEERIVVPQHLDQRASVVVVHHELLDVNVANHSWPSTMSEMNRAFHHGATGEAPPAVRVSREEGPSRHVLGPPVVSVQD